MPKKAGSRPGKPSGLVSRARRPVRQAPRPSAAVPIESEAPVSTAAARPITNPSSGTVTRPVSSSSRLVRPARASSLPAITDYGYVFADLRRIGLLAAVAFVVLIGLTFVVH